MPELTPSERLQPSLLDRLTDDAPESEKEARDLRVLSLRKLREGVLRDLAWLLNTTNLGSTVALESYPYVPASVINYGAAELSGVVASSIDTTGLERMLRQVIWDFEPRILRDTLKVEVHAADQMNHNALTFVIQGELWAQPFPERLYLKSEVDLESGSVTLAEFVGPTPRR